MKVSDLSGHVLDLWVAKAAGVDAVISDPYRDGSVSCITYYCRDEETNRLDGRSYCPSSHWSDGGPIIERERISIKQEAGGGCYAYFDHLNPTAAGETPLIAAMRVYVISKFGAEVPAMRKIGSPE